MFREKGAESRRPVWAEVNLSHIAHNLRQVRKSVPEDTQIMAVVKADAYGHGAIPVASTALNSGVQRLAVAVVDEAKELREAGIAAPIQILGSTLPEELEDVVNYGIIQTITDLETAERLSSTAQRMGKKVRIHLKVDTGMGRIGVFPAELARFARQVSRLPRLEVEGIMTHFAAADEADKDYTRMQLSRFQEGLQQLQQEGLQFPVVHCANSATIIDLPEKAFNLVRPGIMIYGLWPSRKVKHDMDLRPALTWKAKIVYLKWLPEDEGVSYGRTYITDKETRVATLPLGYADGYTRLFSNKSEVLVNGQRAPLIGRVCMDQIMVDVTEIPDAAMGDEVVILGTQGSQTISAADLAGLIGTINYEIVCMISKRVPRLYYK
ncbi:MAG: alanine racemase [Halanaerobium sp.]|nr:alanine racemase [Halanaerobium sp.]